MFAWQGGTAKRTTLGGGSGEGVGSRFIPFAGDTYLREFHIKSAIIHLLLATLKVQRTVLFRGLCTSPPGLPYYSVFPSPFLPPWRTQRSDSCSKRMALCHSLTLERQAGPCLLFFKPRFILSGKYFIDIDVQDSGCQLLGLKQNQTGIVFPKLLH